MVRFLAPMFAGTLAGLCLLAASLSGQAAQDGPKPSHWAFQPVVRPSLPAPKNKRWTQNGIDAFILNRLERERLGPSPEADRRTLIRRVYFDLIGLPPTPEEVAAFQADKRPNAYAELVERLLARPQYGERWARHWLDVVRFAETQGFEMNQPRPNAWPFRDYVIRALNEDKPYNEFVMQQLAGDALGADEATGFLVGGAMDQVKSPDVVLTSNQRADELHDMVSTTGSAFLGLTIGCARCHNHKFDPIPQTDYFAIKAVFEGVQHGERPLKAPNNEARQREAEGHRRKLAEIEPQMAAFEPLAHTGPLVDTNCLRAPVHARLNVERFAPVAAKRLRFTVNATSGGEPCLDELEVYGPAEPQRNLALATAGTTVRASGTYPNSEIHRLEHLHDGKVGNSRSWISNESGKGWVELEFPAPIVINRVVWGRDREEKFADRLATDYRLEVATGTNDYRLAASMADRRPYTAGRKFEPDYATNGLSSSDLSRLNALLAAQREHAARLRELIAAPTVYAGEFKQPGPTYRFHRGDPMQQREEIKPGALGAVPIKFDLGEATAEQQRRLALARWIASPSNPLTARVMVNRLWQYHFGEGIVSTPSDFGANGARPTHPELLDWLATEFVEHGWRLKHIQRLIVNSATYRQAGTASPAGLAADAGTRLLWRFPPRRLEAEPLRDAMLAVSGKLDLQPGGPGFSPFEPNDNYVRVYNPKQDFGPADWRRMVYMTKVRMQQDGIFGAFDCPDGGQIAPKRSRSTTPLQALNLLNGRFVLQQATFFAERLEREVGREPRAQVRRAFDLAFGRPPDAAEVAAAEKIIRAHNLPLFCRALLNANEFVYVF